MNAVPWSRRIYSVAGNLVARALFRVGIDDCTNGFRAVRTKLFLDMPLSERGFPIIVEELYRAKKFGAKIAAVPSTLSARTGDQRPTAFGYTLPVLRSYLKYALRAAAVPLGPRETFKYCIASHVVEHVPDLVSWLREVSEILEVGGILSLVIPDRRYTFDFLRRTSGIADVVDAYVRKQHKPGPRQIFDHFSNFANIDGLNRLALGERQLNPQDPPSKALVAAEDAQRTGNYIDTHCWVFTSDTFIDLLADMAALDLLDFEIYRFFPTVPDDGEFHASLRKLPEMGPRLKRHAIAGSLWEARYQNRLLT